MFHRATDTYIGTNVGYNSDLMETLERGHGMSIDDMQDTLGGTILALGAGVGRWEDGRLAQFGDTNTTVINIDPFYRYERWADHSDEDTRGRRIGHQVVGVGQALPLRTGSVDTAFSTWSTALTIMEDFRLNIRRAARLRLLAPELGRVLKTGGTLRLNPLSDIRASYKKRAAYAELVSDTFTAAGLSCRIEEYLGEGMKPSAPPIILHRLIGTKE
jgi:hypothetical protein